MLKEVGIQNTINEPVIFEGIGLHTGNNVRVTCLPAPADVGFVFHRLDLPGRPFLKAAPQLVADTGRGVTLQAEGIEVKGVEHLLAAAYIAGIDNLHIRMEGSEVPMLDGSALPFLRVLQGAGCKEQDKPRLVHRIVACLHFKIGKSTLVALPADRLRITYIFCGPPPVGHQVLDREDKWEELAAARTFGWQEEILELRRRGLIRGGRNYAVVFDEKGPVNEPRCTEEPVAHKILDLLGDLVLYRRVWGHIIVMDGDHALHNLLARRLEVDITRD